MTPLSPELLKAILDAPGDNNLRLVAADWLSDHDEDGCAQFIRVQVELAQIGKPHRKTSGRARDHKGSGYYAITDTTYDHELDESWSVGERVDLEVFKRVVNPDKPDEKMFDSKMVYGLLIEKISTEKDAMGDYLVHLQRDKQSKPYPARRVKELKEQEEKLCKNLNQWAGNDFPLYGLRYSWKWTRGFISEVSCYLEQWVGVECQACKGEGEIRDDWFAGDEGRKRCSDCNGIGRLNAHGIEIMSREPIETVKILDKTPDHEEDNKHHWYFNRNYNEPDTLPDFLFQEALSQKNDGFSRDQADNSETLHDTKEEANKLLSDILMKWAKRKGKQ